MPRKKPKLTGRGGPGRGQGRKPAFKGKTKKVEFTCPVDPPEAEKELKDAGNKALEKYKIKKS